MKDNLKSLNEKKANLENEMETILDGVKDGERAFTEEEDARFTAIEKELELLNKTIKAIESGRKLTEEVNDEKKEEEEMKNEEKEAQERAIAEENLFENFIRGAVLKERADVNMTYGENGAVVPTTIANKIIEQVVDICPIYSMADRYDVNGDLTIPFYDEKSQAIVCDYADEFTDGESTSGKFDNITLKGYLLRALTKVSKQLINNNKFDIVNFVIKKMAEAISKKIEKELINGTANKIQGLKNGVTQNIVAESATVISSDNLIDVQDSVPDAFQKDAVWIMKRTTRTSIRKLKDADGNYLLNKDLTAKWGYTLLGKDVYCSDNADEIGAGKTPLYYGDLKGLAVKVGEEINIQVLKEKYAEQHCDGILGFAEVDSKVENTQMLSKLTMKNS